MKALFPNAATTRGVTVRVSVSYLPEQSEPQRGRWFWAYHIRLENDGPGAVQLLTRHWIITDGRGYSATQAEFRITSWLSILGSISTMGRESIVAKASKDY